MNEQDQKEYNESVINSVLIKLPPEDKRDEADLDQAMDKIIATFISRGFSNEESRKMLSSGLASLGQKKKNSENVRVLDTNKHDYLSRYIFIEKDDLVFDLSRNPNNAIHKLASFHNLMINDFELVAGENSVKTVYKSKAWMKMEHRMTARDIIFSPGKSRVFEKDKLKFINNFQFPTYSSDRETDKLDVFFEHMNYILPNNVERQWFIGWMGWMLQNPSTRCKVTPLLINPIHGTGRGWIVECIERLVGQWNCSSTKLEVMSGEGSAGQYHDYLYQKTFCAVHEVRQNKKKRYEVGDKIRSILTENRIEINRKGKTKNTEDVFVNFLFMSNHDDALILEDEDRRINVFESDAMPKDSVYYKRLYNWLNTGGMDQLFNYLMTIDLTDFNWQTSMKNQARTNLIKNSKSDAEVSYLEMMQNPPSYVMSVDQVISELDSLCDRSVDRNHVISILRYDKRTKTERMKYKNKSIRVWVLRQKPEMNSEQRMAEYLKCELHQHGYDKYSKVF